ncbi:1-phosphofructokinase family hexose kinase [Phytoactinopolyspora halotolerans]|uniref:1-phosphofructokinase n=1 Tax=Phytoactinopolyspora halotolerans TaxID=1981512 RepID=A0A6L9SFB1_9ACTN|nr:PfkB family carbohydrate kinase [Phytoactinopolyspora halotolerans]NEE02750.1 1-phosphofructokinase [Phytoactinopolyspora halotolerans]
MILTFTPNPSVDRTIGVPHVHRGRVHQGTSSRIDPGGKGVNVARALSLHDAKAVAVIPIGGAEGRVLAGLLEESGVEVVGVPIAQPIRGNVTVTEPDGTTTKFNEPGPVLGGDERAELLGGVTAALSRSPRWLVCCGSLPGGLDDGFYARVVDAGRRRGVPVAVDTSGAALLRAARAGADLLKPNAHELAEVHGRALTTLGDVVDAARALLETAEPPSGAPATAQPASVAPPRAVLVSLGSHGAVLVTAGRPAVRAVAEPVVPRSTVGAGDALLAGYLYTRSASSTTAADDAGGHAADDAGGHAADDAGSHDADDAGSHDVGGDHADGPNELDALVAGVAWGTAAVRLPGSRMPGPDDVAGTRVRVEIDPDLDRHIHE